MKLRNDKKYERQAQAKFRNEEWQKKSLDSQLEDLRKRRGNSTKQINKILAKKENN